MKQVCCRMLDLTVREIKDEAIPDMTNRKSSI